MVSTGMTSGRYETSASLVDIPSVCVFNEMVFVVRRGDFLSVLDTISFRCSAPNPPSESPYDPCSRFSFSQRWVSDAETNAGMRRPRPTSLMS